MDEHNLDDVTPIGVELNSNAINGMWMGDRIANIKGYDLTNQRDILSWLETLVEVHDQYVAEYLGASFNDLEPLVLPTNPLVRWRIIRDTVTNAVKQFADVTSVLDVLDKLGVTLDEYMVAVSTNKYTGSIDRETFAQFESDICRKRPNYMELVRKYGINRNMMKTFREIYEPLVIRQHGHGNDVGMIRKEFHDMIMLGEIPDKEILQIINGKYGTNYVLDSIRWHRKRMKH